MLSCGYSASEGRFREAFLSPPIDQAVGIQAMGVGCNSSMQATLGKCERRVTLVEVAEDRCQCVSYAELPEA